MELQPLTTRNSAALCQIYDSIYQDVPMGRVKFGANAEYAYRENFKILSNTFHKHNIDRPIPVEMLVKCKMQDNLEFLQWTKRFWDTNFPGGEYDAAARRKGAGPGAAPAMPPSRAAPSMTARRPAAAAQAVPRTASRQSAPGGTSAAVLRENAELKESVVGLEKERDFYFSKLRDIELLIQEAIELEPTIEENEEHILKRIQTILYSTEVSLGL